eukprot:TRINITY_DN1584_c0_g1_i1.p1 TRINITY_DN1584_c0_g1~~TRINITY_DN1584_c0_g1_i1.p1  ORF type:complete len:154 (+),score=40.63 TRINITY_DN1584_c0_g1_i1:241-702(+)
MTGRERLAHAESQVRQLQRELAELKAVGDAAHENDLKIKNELLKKELKVLRAEFANSGGGELLKEKEEELQKLQSKYSTMQDAQLNEIRLLKGECSIKTQELSDMNYQLTAAVQLQQELQEENEKLASRYYLLQKERGIVSSSWTNWRAQKTI